ncbi:MAG: ribosome small subunit-dependent GTPase A [Firmicutes bacterium GWF2_51_9]|nr:ribosome small subunit-dependent GTPase A [Erysipelotrichaceae bacterium]OGS54626.1 MAG: ribosome small subunit-dependent GTPase A [Firmicutes bacterium GWF2_51_9]OGS59256.1 MAG: ribosome small subunit-dependent GTPase A [Firmicutes bacterium GWE2_51_13]HAM62308.1 ribosome small subunit-dependent GTPase A [Erysipelotrichaceae bacterium]HAO61248.1 ribosome small subunit-dependent GTPase A [Erysipelotrichaceae bacterium]
MPKARIIKIVSNQYTLLNENKAEFTAVAMGKLRLKKSPVVGDFVRYEQHEGNVGIEEVLPRKNSLVRPLIANVDQALVVMSALKPEFSSVLVDRLCILIRAAGIEPVLIVTKLDLIVTDDPLYRTLREYRDGGMRVVEVGRDRPIDDLLSVLEGKISVLTGQSGVGKSSLVNRLDLKFDLETQEISKALGRGKHTTRHVQLHEAGGGWIADTPGFSSMDFTQLDPDLMENYINEFIPFLGKCRFRNCRHENEPDCAIKQAVVDNKIPQTRYDNYLAIYKMAKEAKETQYQ